MITKKQKDQAFIDKIKTLTIGMGAEAHPDSPPCPHCGDPLEILGNLVIQVPLPLSRKRDDSAEAAFSA